MDGINRDDFLLYLHSTEGMMVCLRNTFHLPYRRPQLPFFENLSTIHRLLEALKTAHASLVKEIVRLAYNPPEGCHGFHELYTVEKAFDYYAERHEIGKHFLERRRFAPFLIDGFYLDAGMNGSLNFSFDLTPFYKDSPDYPGYNNHGLSVDFFAEFRQCAESYNGCVAEFFENGFSVIPLEFVVGVPLFRKPNPNFRQEWVTDI